MLQVRTGNRVAFEILYDRYFDRLVWFAQRFIEDVQKSEDAVQEVFVKIIEKPQLYDSTKRFSTWLFTVTANVCRDIIRNEKNRARLFGQNVAGSIETSVLIGDRLEQQMLK